MTLPGEVRGTQGTTCDDCKIDLPLEVLRSGAGWYIGYFCPMCGPYSRESGYFPTKEAATEAMENDEVYRPDMKPEPVYPEPEPVRRATLNMALKNLLETVAANRDKNEALLGIPAMVDCEVRESPISKVFIDQHGLEVRTQDGSKFCITIYRNA